MTGHDLKIERVRQGVKQLEISRATGINPSKLSKIENGWSIPSDKEVEAICKQLHLDRSALGKAS